MANRTKQAMTECPHGGYPGTGFPAACEQCRTVTFRALGPVEQHDAPDQFLLRTHAQLTLEIDKPMTVHYCAVPNLAECSLTYTLYAAGEVVLEHKLGDARVEMWYVRQHWDDTIDHGYEVDILRTHRHLGHENYMAKCGWLRAKLADQHNVRCGGAGGE